MVPIINVSVENIIKWVVAIAITLAFLGLVFSLLNLQETPPQEIFQAIDLVLSIFYSIDIILPTYTLITILTWGVSLELAILSITALNWVHSKVMKSTR